MKSFLTNLLASFVLVAGLNGLALAQGTPGSGGPGPGPVTPPVNPTQVPLDGGASLLLASGVAYGIKHLRNRRRKA